MRWAAIVVSTVTAMACGPDRYGTYFIADGSTNGIKFDHAEFFFGEHLGNTFGSPVVTAQTGNVYRRVFNAADASVPTDHASDRATYYLAPDGDSNVGSYMLVFARDKQNAIVGVGDVPGFTLAGDTEVVEVRAVLEPPGADVQQWGAGTAAPCVSWMHAGRAPVAFVRDDDRDCDAALVDADCNDFLYCGPDDPSCDTTVALCRQPCALGCQTADGCIPSTCLFTQACDIAQTCAGKPMLTDVLTCFATTGPFPHLDVRLPTAPQNGKQNVPCTYQFSLPLMGPRCANPTIVFAEPFPDGYEFAVEDGGNSSCRFQLNMQNQVPFIGDHHLLIAIDSPSGSGLRSTIFMGVNPLNGAMCTSMVSTENPLTITSCQ